MKRSAALVLPTLLAFSFLVAAQEPAGPLTVEKIYAHGPLIGSLPSGMTWSPDGKHLTYLDGGELIDLDPGSGKPHVLVSRAKLSSLPEADGTEQDRDHRERYKLASYLWAPDSDHLLFDSNGRLWYYDLHNGTGVQVGFANEIANDDPKFSPNGECVSFVRNHGLAVVRPRDPNNLMVFVAAPPGTGILNGEVDWVYEEELDVRSNYFWSPDSRNIAYLQMNESQVPEYPLVDWMPTHALVASQRYPQPADPNPEVRVGVVSASGGKTVWMKLPLREGQDYIPRFGWVDHRTIWIETLTRDHKHRDLFFADASSGQARMVLELIDDKFVDENYDVDVENGNILLTNWNDGHNHIYLYSYDASNPTSRTAKLEGQLTKGEFEVSGISSIEWSKKQVYFTSNEGNPLEQQLWQVGFDGERKALTTAAGYHDVNFSPNGRAFVDTFSTRMTPPSLSLCKTPDECKTFWSTRVLEPYNLRAPEEIEVQAHDGTTLYATLMLPEGSTQPASVPLIVNPYGGPGAQTVVNRWGDHEWADNLLFDELLAQHGFAVLRADNRGMGFRGRAFAQAAYHNLGPIQFEDQLTVLDAVLAKYSQLDKQRLGWWGWSWGGTFTLYALTHSDRFRAGVAVAPVTDWHNYDSIYTERYLSLPPEFPSGYKDFSVVNSAARLKGRLLLVHGTGDDNVHIENTVQFTEALIQAGIPYDLQIYPRKTHSISGSDVRTHLFNRILDHFEVYLKPEDH
ncbi:MAG TPA: alpha/beta fold hydrolase [Terracidiphilus sp.]